MWDLRTKQKRWERFEHTSIELLAFSPDDQRLASNGYEGKLVVWQSYDGRIVASSMLDAGPLRESIWLDSQWLIAQFADGRMKKLNSRTNELDWQFIGDTTHSSLWRVGETLVTSAENGVIRVWDLQTSAGPRRLPTLEAKAVFGSPLATSVPVRTSLGWVISRLDGIDVPVKGLAPFHEGDVGAQLSDDGQVLARVSDGRIQILRQKDDFQISQTIDSPSPYFWLALDAHGERLAAQTTGGDIVIWFGSPFKQGPTIHADSVSRTVGFFTAAGDLLTGSRAGELERWNARTGVRGSRIAAFRSALLPILSTVKDRFFAVGPNGTIQVWALSSNSLVGEVPGLGFEPLTIALDDTSRLLTEWSWDGTSSTWDLAERRVLTRTPTIGPLSDAAVSMGGVSLVSTSGSFVRWPSTTPDMVTEAIDEAIRCGPLELRDDRLAERSAAKLLTNCPMTGRR
jgi:WD40 repeat protein